MWPRCAEPFLNATGSDSQTWVPFICALRESTVKVKLPDGSVTLISCFGTDQRACPPLARAQSSTRT